MGEALHAEKATNAAAALETQPSPKDFDQPPYPCLKIISVASVAAGIQFSWALQLSLLTPYVQLLGVPHKWSSLIWLSGLLNAPIIQPIVHYYTDRCTSRFGRRRPFIAAGVAIFAAAVFLMVYAADLGHFMGDKLDQKPRIRAMSIFGTGIWLLDVANNTLQVPSTALLSDLASGDAKKKRFANACFSFFMVVGSVLGYAAGSYAKLHKMFPFTVTKSCDIYCVNNKSCFFLSITLLLVVTVASLRYVKDKQWSPAARPRVNSDERSLSVHVPFKVMPRQMRMLIIVTALNWLALFPFLVFDTDWMGREVYGGDPEGDERLKKLYKQGVNDGALGLMFNAIVLGFVLLSAEKIGRKLGGVKRLWGIVNLILAGCLAMTVLVTKLAEDHRKTAGALAGPSFGIRAGALSLFALLGIPLAITFTTPFQLAKIFAASFGAGEGVSSRLLNSVILKLLTIVSLGVGPFNALFGGGNLPAFAVGAIAAAISGVLTLTVLHSPDARIRTKFKSH